MKKTLLAATIALGLNAAWAQNAPKAKKQKTNTGSMATPAAPPAQASAATEAVATTETPNPFSVKVLHETEMTKKRDTAAAGEGNYEVDGWETINILYLGYKLTSVDAFRLENRLTTSKKFSSKLTAAQRANNEDDFDASWARIVAKYSRTLMTEKNGPLGLVAHAELRYLPDHEARTGSNSNGLARFSLSFNKSFGPVSLNNTAYFAILDSKNDDPTKSTSYWLLEATQSYNFTEQFSVYLLTEAVHYYIDNGDKQLWDLTLGLNYDFTSSFSAWVNGGSTVYDSSKFYKKTWGSEALSSATYAVGFSYSFL